MERRVVLFFLVRSLVESIVSFFHDELYSILREMSHSTFASNVIISMNLRVIRLAGVISGVLIGN